jgi:hypothetical protein
MLNFRHRPAPFAQVSWIIADLDCFNKTYINGATDALAPRCLALKELFVRVMQEEA